MSDITFSNNSQNSYILYNNLLKCFRCKISIYEYSNLVVCSVCSNIFCVKCYPISDLEHSWFSFQVIDSCKDCFWNIFFRKDIMKIMSLIFPEDIVGVLDSFFTQQKK